MNNEYVRMQMLAGLITESEYQAKMNESKFEMVGSDVDELLDAISFINGGPVKSPFRDVARLKPLDTTGHQISNGKFSIEVELIPSGKVGEKLPNDSEYIQQINSFLGEKYPEIKLDNFDLKKYLAEGKLLKEEKYIVKLHSFRDNKDMLVSSDAWQHEIDMQSKSTEQAIKDFIKDNPTKVKLILYNNKAEATKALGNIKKARKGTKLSDSYSIIKII